MSETAVATAPKEKKPTHNEEIKTAIPTLAGNVAARSRTRRWIGFPTTTRSS